MGQGSVAKGPRRLAAQNGRSWPAPTASAGAENEAAPEAWSPCSCESTMPASEAGSTPADLQPDDGRRQAWAIMGNHAARQRIRPTRADALVSRRDTQLSARPASASVTTARFLVPRDEVSLSLA
jgi:hypothetical protein